MVNFNENILEDNTLLSINNRGFAYGDALFETIKASYGKLLFWEDHYFRLMASMRIMRMEIPMNFTMEYLEEQILKTLTENNLSNASSRVKLTVFRNEGGLYLPETNDISFLIAVKPVDTDFYIVQDTFYEVDLFKDYYVSPSLLSSLKTNNKALNVVGSIYAKENKLDNCLVLNTDKQVIEALNGNVFVVKGNTIKTPPIENGCLKGVMRKQIIETIESLPEYELVEEAISPFELQKADEIFITNVIVGIQAVSKYRKKTFKSEVSKLLIQKLNIKIRVS
ncbi:aminotransferase class IV [Algibacter lectus]|uniref:branched-chain-amino-acid transaminase n=1 Tax=Algibacter lectus TaxID=221126 RepID=A0A090W842_9FLAO|nr:aminotransferase class IV [Algibacter lectus]MWW23266.1 aminotransferase class IV [Algibacter lectus]TDY64059.1 branched-chain amino acid aminotransferase [Algibacter lectus]GAL63702.1 aminodeoxychorismate lyase [Algibacter lectus]GAL80299.1 aminodeoxychorismate lyase [Algibacter lectus]